MTWVWGPYGLGCPSGLLLLAESAIPSASEPYSDNDLRNRVFRQRFAHLHSSERKTSFSGLWRDIAGGSYVGDPCYPARLPYFIQLFLLRLKRFARNPVSTRRFFVSEAPV